MSRIAKRFAELKAADRAAFIPFITAGDPDAEMTASMLAALPSAGADLIELGIPFSDPMADGPAIQASSQRALKAGMTLRKTLDLVRHFRKADETTPIVLMGYFNPIHLYSVERFASDAGAAGVDGLIVVDLPPEEDAVLRLPAKQSGIDLIRLTTPTTEDARLKNIANDASGFLYYVSIAGVTGTKTYTQTEVDSAVKRLKTAGLPVAVGFGIRTPEQAAHIAQIADGAVVGSAIVQQLADALENGAPRQKAIEDVLDFCRAMANAVHAKSA